MTTKRAEASATQLPYPQNDGQTHWDGCWSERHHHNCAVLAIADLERKLGEATRALALLHSEASDPARGFMPSLPCVAIVEQALAAIRGGGV